MSILFTIVATIGLPVSIPALWLQALRVLAATALFLACIAWLLVHVPFLQPLRARQTGNHPMALILVAAFGAILAVGLYQLTSSPGTVFGTPMDVALRFVNPTSPALVIENRSDAVARDIKWAAAIWNQDKKDVNPLPIPVSTFDWIRPHDESGPMQIFAANWVKPGEHLIGSISMSCPDCARGRTYIVAIVWGESGWFGEVENDTSGDLFVPKNFQQTNWELFFMQVAAQVKPQNRVLIQSYVRR